MWVGQPITLRSLPCGPCPLAFFFSILLFFCFLHPSLLPSPSPATEPSGALGRAGLKNTNANTRHHITSARLLYACACIHLLGATTEKKNLYPLVHVLFKRHKPKKKKKNKTHTHTHTWTARRRAENNKTKENKTPNIVLCTNTRLVAMYKKGKRIRYRSTKFFFFFPSRVVQLLHPLWPISRPQKRYTLLRLEWPRDIIFGIFLIESNVRPLFNGNEITLGIHGDDNI